MVKNDRILVLIGGLFVSNFALVDYSKLKFLHYNVGDGMHMEFGPS